MRGTFTSTFTGLGWQLEASDGQGGICGLQGARQGCMQSLLTTKLAGEPSKQRLASIQVSDKGPQLARMYYHCDI